MRKPGFSPLFMTLSILMSQLGLVTSVLANDSHVGDIRYSILSEAQFRALHGTEWELLQGQPVPRDSELIEYWGDRNLPDARGVFLRSRNHNRDRQQGCPAGDLNCGSYQDDQLKSHNHSTFSNHHSHVLAHGTWKTPSPYGYPNGGEHNTSNTGGSETRPRNITVNTFIKVRESAPARPQTQISAEWVAQLFSSAEFLRSLRQAVTAAFRAMI
jgi:hypothetical protein